MLRTILSSLGLIAAWIVLVAAVVFMEAFWFAEPDVIRGDAASITQHLHSNLERSARDGALGAAALAVLRDGEVVFEHGYGRANAETGASVDAERTLFQVGSVSKAVTAFGVMKLVQDGKIGLDEPVIHRMKRWRFAGNDDRKNHITIRNLLSHTAGIDDPSGYDGFLPDQPVQSLEEYLSGVRVSREPGTAFVYGNAASGILQLLIEDVTGNEFHRYMEANVLRPLGMTNSTFDLETARGRLAAAYDQSVTPGDVRRHSIPAAVALYTSGRDLGRFAAAIGGGNAVLNEESMRLMRQPAPATGESWGLGLALFTTNELGETIIGHDGGARPSWGAMVRLDPSTRNGMVVAVSGGRGAANELSHDWVYWATGKMTDEARRQKAYGRVRVAALAIVLGSIAIAAFGFRRYRRRRATRLVGHS